LKDFKRAVALQANPDQVIQFRRLTESTQVARKSAQDLLKLAENRKTDLSRSTNPLGSAPPATNAVTGSYVVVQRDEWRPPRPPPHGALAAGA